MTAYFLLPAATVVGLVALIIGLCVHRNRRRDG